MSNETMTNWSDPKLAELLADQAEDIGVRLSTNQIKTLLFYGQEFEQANQYMNLSTIVHPEEVIRKHFVDSLTALPYLPAETDKLIDIGSGAGFPGLALKIVCPETEVTLIESIKKKANFLRQTAAALGLTDINVCWRRAEEAGQDQQFREKFSVATARAVAALPVLLELALPLVAVGGWFIAYKGPNVAEEIQVAETALAILGGELAEVKEFSLAGGEQRSLVLVRKAAPTPAKYPRGPGRPAKRPL
ncbi:MAG TPA: 16S rRNA (guanine(527)-N(7))-methyltransferase RsmG [Firmicutes bacterium]|nr:16S rRNA (guanine(527)-N(7))-methyltransferase RsmG [Bacillota bacterium]